MKLLLSKHPILIYISAKMYVIATVFVVQKKGHQILIEHLTKYNRVT